MSCARVEARRSLRGNTAGEGDMTQAQGCSERSQPTSPPCRLHQRERRVRVDVLHASKRPKRTRHVVERHRGCGSTAAAAAAAGVACRESDRAQSTLGTIERVDAKSGKHVAQVARRHRVAIDAAQCPPRDRGALEMIGRLAAAIVEHDRLAQRLRDQNRRQRGESRNDVYEAEKTWTTSACRSCWNSSGT